MATTASSSAPNYGTIINTSNSSHPKHTGAYLFCSPRALEANSSQQHPSSSRPMHPTTISPRSPLSGTHPLSNRTDDLLHMWIIHSSFETIIKLAGLVSIILGGLVGCGCYWFDPRGYVLLATWAVVWGWYCRGWKMVLALMNVEWYYVVVEDGGLP
ncbi:hypothetical protein BZA77DRAFT_356970 [Pyronema omphalodes]|nr:hypothetical protein BZA77DRAFT_356970 [Pyronema omphalodes]